MFAFALLVFFVHQWISSLPKTSDLADAGIEISAKTGESLFWGKGRCLVCHRVGARGSGLRCPDLGAGRDGPAIAIRAQSRALNLDLKNPTEYLVQSLTEPGAFLVPGYKNEMPWVLRAPIFLTPAEIKAVVCYLQSLGGIPNPDEIELPEKVLAYYNRPQQRRAPQVKGSVEDGRRLFFDVQGPAACAACHVGKNAAGEAQGSNIGPDLSAIASIRTPEFILQQIVNPDSLIVSGYETSLFETDSGRLLVGLVQEKNEQKIVLVDKAKRVIEIDQATVASITPQTTSIMPGNYAELLTRKQLQNLLAYLLTLTGK